MELRRVGALYLARHLVLGGSGRSLLAAWLLLALALLAVRGRPGFSPGIAHDSFQYLSVARQAVGGAIGTTALVHFDAERSFGVAPAPMVTFPLGYPLAMALLHTTGMPATTAGLLISVAALLLCLALLWRLTERLEITPPARHAVIGIVALNGALLQMAGTIATELLFTLLVLAAVALLLRARLRAGFGGWIAAGLVLGLTYHVRYAGLFLVVALVPVALRYTLRRATWALAGGYAAAFGAAVLVMAIGMARNVVLVGNWRGGNEKPVSNELAGVVYQTFRAGASLVLGAYAAAPSWLVVARGAAFVLLFLAVAWLVRRRLRPAGPAGHPVRDAFLADLAIVMVGYGALMFYAGLTTVISYGTRMFVPMVPLLALLIGSLADQVLRAARTGEHGSHLARVALVGFLALYAPLNLLALQQTRVDRATLVMAQMDEGADEGGSVRGVLDRLAPPDRVIVANNGQAVGYVLGRPTVSLVGPRYSAIEWSEAALRDVIERYSAAAVVITAPNARQPDEPDLIPSPFVRDLARGQAPAWLRLTFRRGDILVYRPASPEVPATAARP